MPIVHLTARLRPPRAGLADDERAPWLWARLRERFPRALAATLMPNHPHLVADVDDVEEAHAGLVRVLTGYARRVKEPSGPAWSRRASVWEPIPPPEIIEGPDKVARQLRYTGLNAPRAGLVHDVLGWRWSTHLDVVGAIDDPWVTFERVQRHLPARLGRSLEAYHAYVSPDPSTHVGGTTLPRAVEREQLATRPLADILEAVAWATRASVHDVGRRGRTRAAFVWLAREQGWTRTGRIAEICGIAPRSVARIIEAGMPTAVLPARRCLDLLDRARAPTALARAG